MKLDEVQPVRIPIAPLEKAPTGRVGLARLSATQWRSGVAAWLGWLFDGLDMHLYTLVATPLVATLLVTSENDPQVGHTASWIQASFLVGWALGGGFFGRLGDHIGRSRSLTLTILTYALFTGLSFFATTWWHLLICRFLAALGIGGEWAVGASLLSETWPKSWRAWIAATLQSAVNLGVLLAAAAAYALSSFPNRYVFLVGILPALLVVWIRMAVPEPDQWESARRETVTAPSVADLFRGSVRRVTLLTTLVCACGLTGHWAFMFWFSQHLRRLPEIASWTAQQKTQLASTAMVLVMIGSIAGNYIAAMVARKIGYRRSLTVLFLAYFLCIAGTYATPLGYQSQLACLTLLGACGGVFGLFTMYLPPLFPTLLRTTGAGFSYNIGRIAAAAGTVVFGLYAPVDDYRKALFFSGVLFVPAALFALLMPELRDEPEPTQPVD